MVGLEVRRLGVVELFASVCFAVFFVVIFSATFV